MGRYRSVMCAVCYSDSWEFHSQGVTNLDGWDGAESEGWRHFEGGGRLGDCCKYGVVELKADERQRRGCCTSYQWCPLWSTEGSVVRDVVWGVLVVQGSIHALIWKAESELWSQWSLFRWGHARLVHPFHRRRSRLSIAKYWQQVLSVAIMFGELSRFELYSELFLVGDSDVSQARLDQIGES